MSWKLPAADSRLRIYFDMISLAEKRWTTMADSLRIARVTFAEEPKPLEVFTLTIQADDTVVLLKHGPRGSHRVLWTFGRPYDAA